MGLDLPIAYSQAYVTPVGTVRRVQQLPHGAAPKVAIGQIVRAMEVIAVVEMPDERRLIDIAKTLKMNSRDVTKYLLKQEGDLIHAEEPIAMRRGFLGLSKKRVLAPFDGRVAWMGEGQALLEGGLKRVEIMAAAPGRVLNFEPGEFIAIESHGAVIELAWGHGGLVWGTVKVMDVSPTFNTETGRFNIDHRGAIVVIGSPLSEQFLKEAIEIRVKGIVAASMHASLIPLVQQAPFPVGITQGFGQLSMSERILSMLSTHNGREISLDMGQVFGGRDSREIRPEIIIPMSGTSTEQRQTDRAEQLALRAGDRVRILQTPYMGELGTVTEIVQGSRQVESGLWLAGALIEVAGSQKPVFVPFANLQQLG